MNEPHPSADAPCVSGPYRDAQEASQVYLLPCLFTAGNMFFGFLAIIRCIQARYCTDTDLLSTQYYTQAVWLILLACVCDVFDGMFARLGNRQSLFGKEFDSIADVVSFGVAPALMVFFSILSPTENYPFFRQVGWIIGFIYLLCAAARLARYNVLTSPFFQSSSRCPDHHFVGLPVPAAAGVIASLVLVLTEFDLKGLALLLPGLMLLIAWLMISSVPYPSIKSIDWHTKARLRSFVLVVIGGLVLFLIGQSGLALFFLGYLFYGLFRYWKKKPLAEAPADPSPPAV
jgi:CDP-diacylglycerol--serine O-phosphatidyltransferase